MREHIRENKVILLFSLAWLVLNLVQSFYTEIMEDEAYYWLYSRFPAWGYFDHPPMTAMLIKIGYSIFPNELGLRLLPSLMGAATIYLIWLLIPSERRNPVSFMIGISGISLAHLNVVGFVATPDIPLVFHSVLFFTLLKNYFRDDKLSQALLLGLVAALMMYSKYHALLIFFFTVLSNLKLLTRRSFWLIVLTAGILYLPHILWQFRNDFASFQFHLVDRNTDFRIKQLVDYFLNQLAVTGPLIGILFLYLSFSKKNQDRFERMLKFNLVGFFTFFMLSSIRGHVEPHWTAAAFPPMVILGLSKLPEHPGLIKWFRILGISSIPMVLIIRIYLIWDILPLPSNLEKMFHQKDVWAEQISELAGERTVVFANRFQDPSIYWFYTGKPAFARNNIYYRRNQFDIWPMEERLEGKPVIFRSDWTFRDEAYLVPTVHGEQRILEIERYCSYNRLGVEILEENPSGSPGEILDIDVRISNPTGQVVHPGYNCDFPALLESTFFGKDHDEHRNTESQPDWNPLKPGSSEDHQVRILLPEKPGSYSLVISLGSEVLYPGINGFPVSLTVTD